MVSLSIFSHWEEGGKNGPNGKKKDFFHKKNLEIYHSWLFSLSLSLTNVDSSETTFHKRECQNFWKPDTWQPTNKSRLLKKDSALY